MSLHKLSAGSGYTYLTRQVAAGDDTARGRGSLGGYYAERGESPGIWLGGGLSCLDGGPRPGEPVAEAQMVALFGHGHHPNDAPTAPIAGDGRPGGRALGTPFVTAGPRTSVAGYDLTFSPVKSVSALWALAPPDVAAQIEAAHHAAVADTIGWLERTAVFTRLGTGGLRQVDVTGLLAVAFTHRDSRAGDPDPHTHVVISNKVRTLDGRWRALDGRALYSAIVAASERYNTRLEAGLVDRLGVVFTERQVRPGARPVRELAGIPAELIRAWSSRRASILDAQAELVDRFVADHGHQPTRAQRQALAQQATLATRPGKHGPRSITEQRLGWQLHARFLLGRHAADRVTEQTLHRTAAAAAPPADWTNDAARAAVATVSAERAVFGPHHVRAELERLARAGRIPLRALDAAIDAALTVALSEGMAVRLDRDPDRDRDAIAPVGLRRRDGTSAYTLAHGQRYTSPAVLDAEQRILAAAERTDGRRMPTGLVELALLEARAAGHRLNGAQQAMVRELASSGRPVQVALAPAGTGKTATLGVLAAAWADAGGAVVGAAPSAVAAAALGEATGQPTVTLAAAVHSLRGRPDGVQSIGSIALGPGLLVLVDEAGMAATPDLATVIEAVTSAGGSVRLVGDTAQLSSPAAGGILLDLVRTHGASELDTPVRFTDTAEAQATLAIRAGDPAGLDFYVQQHRIHQDSTGGKPDAALEGALAAWAADRAAGRNSLLLAGSNAVVIELNARARAARLRAEGNVPPAQVRLRDGTAASPGDLVLARHNDRTLRIGGRGWVKNGDRFTVLALTGDGGLHVQHTSGRRLTLPAGYVAEHLQLGHAATIHLAQGATVDTTHTLLTGRESREQLYVALTRGRAANHLHLAPTEATDPDDPAHPALARPTPNPGDPLALLRAVLARTDAKPSATSVLADAADLGRRLDIAVERYLDAHALHAATVGQHRPPSPDTGGPLPWLPPPPDPDGGELAEYVQRRADLVHALATALGGDHPPATGRPDPPLAAGPDPARPPAAGRAPAGVPAPPDVDRSTAPAPGVASAPLPAPPSRHAPAAPPAATPPPAPPRAPLYARLTPPPPRRPRLLGTPRPHQRGIGR